MKYILISLMTFFFSNTLLSQDEVESNDWVLGGSFSFSSQNGYIPFLGLLPRPVGGGIFSSSSYDVTYKTLSFNPYFGKQLNKNALLGVSFIVSSIQTDREGLGLSGSGETFQFESQDKWLGFGIFYRQSKSLVQDLSIYVEPYANYNFGNGSTSVDSEETGTEDSQFFKLGVSAGFMYQFGSKLRATLNVAALEYINGSWESDDGFETESADFNSFGMRTNLSSIRLGFEILF